MKGHWRAECSKSCKRGSEGGRRKRAVDSTSSAAHPTASPVRRRARASNCSMEWVGPGLFYKVSWPYGGLLPFWLSRYESAWFENNEQNIWLKHRIEIRQ